MGLFRISKELQFRVCNHGELHAVPLWAREGECFLFLFIYFLATLRSLLDLSFPTKGLNPGPQQ